MHFHLPKPMHGWREFVGEVGIIVIGVLIALGAEQLIEHWRWQHKVTEATAQLDSELQRNAESAYQWLAFAPCVDARLQAIDEALTSARNSGRVLPTPELSPPLTQFTEDAWLNARALQVADHLSPKVIADYSRLYFLPHRLATTVAELHQEAGELRLLSEGVSPISPEEVGSYQRQASRVHERLERVELAEKLLLERLKLRGIAPTQEEMDADLKYARSSAGACVRAPDMTGDPDAA